MVDNLPEENYNGDISVTVDTLLKQGQRAIDLVILGWAEMSAAERELLIPRLLRETDLGRRISPAAGVAWRPIYVND